MHFALEPRRWKAWTLIFPMANSTTKFLPLASLGHLAWHRPKQRSLVPILYRLHFPCLGFCFCFAPARVKVKHYDHDPIWTPGGPQNVKQSIAEHFAKKTVWPPRAICYAMGKIYLWCVTVCHPIIPVDVHACETACCQSSPASQLCKPNVRWLMTRTAPMLSWQQREFGASCSVHGGIGKSSKATLSLWFIRRIVSDQSSPFSRTQPTIDRNILRCNTLMLSNCTFVRANVCKLKSMAGVTTALRNSRTISNSRVCL